MPDQQINRWGKLLAGLLLIAATAFAVNILVEYWPNKMPPLGKGDDAWYTNTPYKMTLIDSVSSSQKNGSLNNSIDSLKKSIDTVTNKIRQKMLAGDSSFKKDSSELKKLDEALKKLQAARASSPEAKVLADHNDRIHLNTILLILVATMGFLGNMVHIASSFTSFVGNGSFDRSWILWYFVKPFTAAALALIVYFIIRAGFLNYSSDASNVSLYGILSLAALTGLFTDNATLKLKEVFDVIFKPKDERTGKLNDFKIEVTSVTPDKIDVTIPNKISIKGKNLNKKKIQVKINGSAINIVPADSSIDFIYTVEAADKTKTAFEMIITDEDNNLIYKKTFTV